MDSFHNMMLNDFLDFVSQKPCFIKMLTANDTSETGGHQCGIYIPKKFLYKHFPNLNRNDLLNPEIFISNIYFPSHNYQADNVKAIYYNSQIVKGASATRNEFRFTRFGGQNSPVTPNNTGKIFVCAFLDNNPLSAIAWVARSIEEASLIEEHFNCRVTYGSPVTL